MSRANQQRRVQANLSVAVAIAAFFALSWLASVVPASAGQQSLMASLAGSQLSSDIMLRSVGWSLAFGLGGALFAMVAYSCGRRSGGTVL